jgi:hypothetical protein
MTMLTKTSFAKVLSLFLFSAWAAAQSVPVAASHHHVQTPEQPAPLFTGEQVEQRAEVHFDPATNDVMMKLLVQDSAGYSIPGLPSRQFCRL